MNTHNIWLYGDYRLMRVGIGNDTGRSDCKYYHVLTMNLGAENPQWRKLSGGGNYAHNEIDKAEQEMREKLHGDIHQLTDQEAYKLFGLEHSHDVYRNPPADCKEIWDAIMKPASERKKIQVKTRNNRCPLQQECERTCKCIGQERNCDYYHNNCLPGMEIDGQEVNFADDIGNASEVIAEKTFASACPYFIGMTDPNEDGERMLRCKSRSEPYNSALYDIDCSNWEASESTCRLYWRERLAERFDVIPGAILDGTAENMRIFYDTQIPKSESMDEEEVEALCLSEDIGLKSSNAPTQAAVAATDNHAGVSHTKMEAAAPPADADSCHPSGGSFPADASAATQSLSVAEAASLEADAPLVAFDYAELDDATAQELRGISDMVVELNRNYAWGMANAVGRAHDLLCGEQEACLTVRQAQSVQGDEACPTVRQARNNQYSESTFTAWCVSMGLTRPTAYNLLNAYRVISTATHTEQDVLQNAPAALLYAAGKKDAPEQLVDAVKSGDITTNAEYQRLLTEMEAARNAADTAERRAKGLEDSYHTAHKNEEYAIKRVQEAEKERDGARQALQSAKLRGDKLREENEALKARPIEVKGVDPDEIERRAAQRARELSEPLQEQIRQLQEDLTRAPQGAASEDDANRLYDQIVLAKRTIESVWGIARETLCQLPDELRSGARQLVRETLQKITEEL